MMRQAPSSPSCASVTNSGSVLNAGVNGEDPAAASRDRHHVYCRILFTIFLDKLVLSKL